MMSELEGLALFTDLYELTMAACYFDHQMFDPATFSLFIRRGEGRRSYFVSAGLEEVLKYLQSLRFSQDDLGYLEQTGLFRKEFLDYLEGFRFRGDVWAIPEGRIFFPNEPILEVTASIVEAQVVETFIINAMNLQTMIATKASRCVHAAGPRKLVDFSLRRTQGTDAGMKVARASYMVGFLGTSNVAAGKRYGIPIFGTMAHSFIMSFDREIEAFRAFAQSFPENTVLLVDTYDTLQGTRKAVRVGQEMARRGQSLSGLRLDSGNMARLSRRVRSILREGGLEKTVIFASGAFDEYKIQEVLANGGDIDSFGVGTKMGVSADAPYLDMAYKLVKYADRPVFKLSPEKATLPSDKQVFRFYTSQGLFRKDVIAMREEEIPGGEPLLQRVMHQGKPTGGFPPLNKIREVFLEEFSRLGARFKRIQGRGWAYPVVISPGLKALRTRLLRQIDDVERSK